MPHKKARVDGRKASSGVQRKKQGRAKVLSELAPPPCISGVRWRGEVEEVKRELSCVMETVGREHTLEDLERMFK